MMKKKKKKKSRQLGSKLAVTAIKSNLENDTCLPIQAILALIRKLVGAPRQSTEIHVI
jgi:hypothetical protein